MRQIVFLATKEQMLVEENRFDLEFGDSPPEQLSHPDAPTTNYCFWCKDIDNEQDEFWFYLPADKLRRVRAVQAPRGGRSQIVFLATDERMLVEENAFGSKLATAPPEILHHPDKPTEAFRFWRKDRSQDQSEFWFYLPASQFETLDKILQ